MWLDCASKCRNVAVMTYQGVMISLRVIFALLFGHFRHPYLLRQ
jgi:hypothetical protein